MTKTIDRKWWLLISIGTGSFMSALDGSVVNTVLPILRDAFKSDITTIEWVVTVYLLVLSGLLLSFGRLGDLRGHKVIYVWGFGIFILSSALCGMSWSPVMLIVFRGIQAIGGAMLASNSPAIITGNFSADQRGRAFGLASTMTYLGLTVGPSLGGWLTQAFGWRSVFYINVPVGGLAIALSLIFIPRDTPVEHGKRFDLPGALVFMLGLTALLLGLNQGAELGWTSFPVIGLLAAAVLLLGIFIVIERRSPEPMLDLSLFRIPLFSTSTASAVLNYICVYSITFLMPFYLIQGRGLNPAQAGLLLTAQPILMAIAAPISGALSDRFGSRGPGMLGMSILSGGLFLLSRIHSGTELWFIVIALILAGIGTGTFISPNTSALMGAAPRARQGIASGVQATARNFGMVLGIGLAGAILTTHLAQNTVNALYQGIDMGFLAAAGVALLGVAMSAAKSAAS
ncbi:MAG TPA: MFS transporter [Anaerolineales bacterium]|nr:MFS transporter [Anaerolineales bacterium]